MTLKTTRWAMVTLACALCWAAASAQIAGNGSYGQNGGRPRIEQADRAGRGGADVPPDDHSMFIDAAVLMNVKADEYVAVFSVAEEGQTIDEANQKVDTAIRQFTDGLKPLKLRESDVFVDFIAAPKIYGYDIADNVAREKLTGFELKKNVSVHYAERDLIDKVIAAAAKAQIYDLVKVDYVVKDTAAIQSRLLEEAAAIVKQKIATNERLLGIKVEAPAEIYAMRPAIYYPPELYDSYAATESETVSRPPNLSKMTVQQARKSRTFYFNGMNANGFDKVINPVVVEPVVQFTLYLKMKYTLVR
jgi:uncharacterized protein YggE